MNIKYWIAILIPMIGSCSDGEPTGPHRVLNSNAYDGGVDEASKHSSDDFGLSATGQQIQERFNGDKWASLSRPLVTIFKGSDILFSVRKGRCLYSKDPEKDDTLCLPEIDRFMAGFDPNRLVWHYPFRNMTSTTPNPKPSLILPKFKGIDPSPQCSINVFVDLSDPSDIHCKDLAGKPVKAPWEMKWYDGSRPDVMKDRFIELQKAHVESLIGSGCRVLQQDSVSLNFETLQWGGCFSAEGDRKFRAFLSERYPNPNDLRMLSHIEGMDPSKSDFSITSYFIGKNALDVKHDSDDKRNLSAWIDSHEKVDEPLLHLYREFSNYKSLEYLQLMKITAKNKLGGSYVPLSGNVAFYDKNFPLYQVLDFLTAEWVDDRKTLPGFLDMVRFSERLGKKLVGTPASDDLNLHRSLFSSAYALGNHMILPFDVYIDSNTDRYHVPLEKFKDLTDFARSNGQKLDDTLSIETYGASREPITAVEKYCGGRICDKSAASWDRTLIRHARMDQFKTIAKGSKVLINGKTYETVASSTNGSIYLKPADWITLGNFRSEKLGVESIVGPIGTPVFDLTISLYSGQMPAWNAPKVVSVDFGISKVGHTTIRTTLEDRDFPRGTEFGFSETKYRDATDVGTRVGQIYFNANLIDKVFPGQSLSWIQKPGQQRRYFESSSLNSGFLKFPAGEFDLLASVRKKRIEGKTQSILHLVNWSSQFSGDARRLRSTVIDVDFEKIFGFAPSSVTKCQLSQAGVPGEVLIKPQQIVGSSRYAISVKDLWTWGMITCN